MRAGKFTPPAKQRCSSAACDPSLPARKRCNVETPSDYLTVACGESTIARLRSRAQERTMTDTGIRSSKFVVGVLMIAALSAGSTHSLSASESAANASAAYAAQQRDGSHDFDFLIGDWKAHVRRLPDRLNGSNAWDVYDGISNHKKLLDTNANFEEFDVSSSDRKLHIKAQTLRVYNPETHQWSIYGLDLEKGEVEVPPVVGLF